jgi:type IX secretion system substrate protein
MKYLKHIFICFLFVGSLKAQTFVAIPDSNFVHYLKTIVPAAFKGDSLNKNSTLVTTTTKSINVAYKSIANLSGVQYFNSLTYLNCYQNSLTSLPVLSNTLDTLICDLNLITSLPNLPNTLTYLSCCCNSLTSLPNLPNSIAYLDCNSNHQITTLPLIPNTLTNLYCGYDNITCFQPFPSSIIGLIISPNPYNCLPNYVLPAMNSYTTTPLCAAGNSNGCPVAVAGINELKVISDELKVYPNPASTSLTLTLSKGEGTYNINITDMLGNTVKQIPFTTQNVTFNISDLSNGMYLLRVLQNGNAVYTTKVIKED